METMPEEMIFAASTVTLGSMLLFAFSMFYEINNKSLSGPLFFMFIGSLLVILSSAVRIFGAFFRNQNKIKIFHYKEEGRGGKRERKIFYLLLLSGLFISVVSLLYISIIFLFNFSF